MKFLKIALSLLLVCQIALAGHEAIHDKESFLKVYNSNKPTKDIAFVKKHFPTVDKVMDRVEYINFLTAYLNHHIDDLPEDNDIKEEADLHHKEQAEEYLKLQNEKDKEEFGIDEVVRDIGIGNLMVFVGGAGSSYTGDDDHEFDTMDYMDHMDHDHEMGNTDL